MRTVLLNIMLVGIAAGVMRHDGGRRLRAVPSPAQAAADELAQRRLRGAFIRALEEVEATLPHLRALAAREAGHPLDDAMLEDAAAVVDRFLVGMGPIVPPVTTAGPPSPGARAPPDLDDVS